MDKKNFDIYKFFSSRTAMMISGIVCAIPFVFEKAWILSWFAYIPVVTAFAFPVAEDKPRVFSKSFIFAFFYYAVGYSWFCELYPMDYAGFTNFQSLLIVLLAITAIPAIHGLMFTLCVLICRAVTKKAPDILRVLAFPAAVMLAEYLQSLGALAFPWCRVFVAQASFTALLQSASLFGSYFITFLVTLFNVLLAYAIAKPEKRKLMISVSAGIFACNLVFGVCRQSIMQNMFEKEETGAFYGAVLQGNYPSGEKWSSSTSEMHLRYLELADQALESLDKLNKSQVNAEEGIAPGKQDEDTCDTIIVTPETALPITLKQNSSYSRDYSAYAQQNNICLAAGAFSDENGESGNAVFMYLPDGSVSRPYVKRHLVPFGEYLPYRPFFETFLPVLAEINILSEDQARGKETGVFETPVGKVGTLICYESIFPELCRDSVKAGAQIILVSTNDSWFGTSRALTHHLANAKMRAIENNVPVLRAANTGISALIRPDGTVTDTIGAGESGFLAGKLPYGSGNTLYTYIGDIWIAVYTAVIFVSAMLLKLTRKQ